MSEKLEADVVIVGFGAAGAAAALTASDNGADVLVIEKQPQDRHTPSSKLGGGVLMTATDVEKAADYLNRCASGMVPEPVSRAWAEHAVGVLDFVDRAGPMQVVEGGGAEHPEFAGSEAIKTYRSAEGGSGRWFAHLSAALARRKNITVEWDTAGSRLVRDADQRIVGLDVLGKSGGHRIAARQGVILTCGGYEYDEEMKLDYLKGQPIYFYGNPGNTGDGVRMAQDVGASLWHMNQMIGRAIAHFEEPGGLALNCLVHVAGNHSLAPSSGYVLTDGMGRRFANEYMQAMSRHDFYYLLLAYDPETNDFPRNPCYWIFDQRRMDLELPVGAGGGLVAHGHRGYVDWTEYYTWSENSEAEIAKGWVHRADSIEEVAAMAGVSDPKQAAKEVEAYNASCASGKDRLGRPKVSLIPLDQPPYYCIPLYPGGSNTSGGPRRNENAQILDAFGSPIEGLYSAGELGEPIGLMYPSFGANISDCLCFGQIAAEHALGVIK